MKPRPKVLWAAGAVLLAAHAQGAVATGAPNRHEPSWDEPAVRRLVPSAGPAHARRLIHSAACDLQQAALQADFASNERVLTLLQSAQDSLAEATGSLWRERWQQADRLLSHIDQAIEHGSAQQGPGASPDGGSVGPSAPSPAALAALASEGRALEGSATPLRLSAAYDGAAGAADASLTSRSNCGDRHSGQLSMENSMNSKLKTALVASIAAGLAGTAVSASAATSSPLQEQHYGQIAYATGGIGKAEAKQFESRMSSYPLAVEVLEKTGKAEEFTAGADVKIADSHGHTVFDAKTDGPFLLVDLPKGRYSVVASLSHKTLPERSVDVAPGHTAHATFEFP